MPYPWLSYVDLGNITQLYMQFDYDLAIARFSLLHSSFGKTPIPETHAELPHQGRPGNEGWPEITAELTIGLLKYGRFTLGSH